MLRRGFDWLFPACLPYRLAAAVLQSKPRSVRLALISEGVNIWPLYVAQEKKLFEKEGTEVEVTLTRSSVKQLEQLKAGEFDIGFQQCDHVVRAVEHGSDLFIFMALAHALELSLVVAPGIRSFAELKGRVIAVDGARSGYALLLRKLLANQGLGDGDYAFREIGGSQERWAALRAGIISAGLLNSPFDRSLFAAGFGSLGTTADYFPTYMGSIAAARRSWAQLNSSSLTAFIRGMNAAFTWLRAAENKTEAIGILRKRLAVDTTLASDTFDEFVRRPRPSLTEEGLRQAIDLMWDVERFPGPRGTPDKYLDLSYLREALREP